MNKELPKNIEAEKCLLGSMFWSRESLQKGCEEASRDIFYLESHAKIFEAIRTLYLSDTPVDVTSLTTYLISVDKINEVGGVEYINEIVNSVATGASIEYYINLVSEKYTLRKMIEVATNIVTKASNVDISAADTIDEAEKDILNISKFRKTSEFRKIQDVLTKAQNDLEMLSRNGGKIKGITTGFGELDSLTEGLHPTQLIILAARPAVGKTAFALNLALAAAKSTKKNIAIFSLEMPAEQLMMRMISSLGQIDNKKLSTGKLENDDWKRFNEAISILADTNVFFHDAGGVTPAEIKAKCRRLATQGEGLGLVIIDYLQLIDSSARYAGSRQQEVSEISRALKTMALELEVPVIALSQLSRSVEKREDKKPVLSDLRESGSIEQDADIVAALHNPEVDVPATGDDIPVPIQLIILKHRNGPTKTIDLLFRKKTSTFLSIKRESDNGGK